MAGLIGWTISLIPSEQNAKILAGVVGGINAAIYLLTQFNVGGSRSATVIKSTAWAVLVISTIIIAIMAIWCVTPAYYIIPTALIALIFLTIAIGVARSGQ